MYKVEINNGKQPAKLLAKDTKVGDLMVITKKQGSGLVGEILLNTAKGFITLGRPSKTYPDTCEHLVRILPKGTVITLTVE